MTKTANKQIKIKLVKSLIGCSEAQRKVAKALGFTKKDQIVEHYDSPVIMGMVNKISHLLEIVEQPAKPLPYRNNGENCK